MPKYAKTNTEPKEDAMQRKLRLEQLVATAEKAKKTLGLEDVNKKNKWKGVL